MAPLKYPHGLLQVASFWAAILAGLAVIGLLAYLLSHWGWWKLRQSGSRRPLVRTWHGWVESSAPSEKRPRNRLRKPPPHIVTRIAKTDYSWIFWDPTGAKRRKFEQEREETWVRYLPRWMRSSPFGSANAATNPNLDVEAARSSEAQESEETPFAGHLGTLSLLGRHWRPSWRRAGRSTHSSDTYVETPDHRSADPSACIPTAAEDISDENINTIRFRKTSRQYRSDWNANSEDVERATNNQLLAPTAAFNLAHLFQRPAQKTEGPSQRGTSPSSCEQGRAGYTASHYDSTHNLSNDHESHRTRSMQWPYRLPRTQSRRDLNKMWHTNVNGLHAPCPSPKRIPIWPCEIENTRPSPASVVGGRDDRSIDGDPDCMPPINVPKTRKSKGAWSTDGSAAEAEKMSVISVPSILFVGGNGHDRIREGEDFDRSDGESFGSVPGSWIVGIRR